MPVVLSNKVVSATFGDHFYICDSKEVQGSGIRVNGTPPTEGSYADISGNLNTLNGERVIIPWHIESSPGPGTPDPLFMLTRCVGGARLNPYTPGITSGIGTNNIGLLIATAGRVTRIGNSFLIDDGSGTQLEVDSTTLTNLPDDGCFVFVTGIRGTRQSDDRILPLLKPRRNSDVIVR